MPRLGKRKRDGQRPPRPDRLADLILAGEFAELAAAGPLAPSQRADDRRSRERMVAAIRSRSIDATSIHRHVLAIQDADSAATAWNPMIVDSTPPGPLVFVESEVAPELSQQIARFGWAIETYRRGEEPQLVYDGMLANPVPGVYERCERIAVGTMAMAMKIDPGKNVVGALAPAAEAIIFLDASGAALAPPVMAIPGFWTDPEDLAWIRMWAAGSLFDVFMAFGMLSRGAATVVPCEPPAEVSRERRRAGLTPFVRYESVVIRPARATA